MYIQGDFVRQFIEWGKPGWLLALLLVLRIKSDCVIMPRKNLQKEGVKKKNPEEYCQIRLGYKTEESSKLK